MSYRFGTTLRFIWRSAAAGVAILSFATIKQAAHADDWGAYAIVPSSAPGMALEVVGGAKTDGAIVSIGRAADVPNQKWIVVPKGNGFYTIRPSYGGNLILAAAKGGTNNGKKQTFVTPAILFGRFPIHKRVALAGGAGFQIATTHYHQYNHAPVFTIRFPF